MTPKIPYLNLWHWLRHKLGEHTGDLKVWNLKANPDLMLAGYVCRECGVLTDIHVVQSSLKRYNRKFKKELEI